MTVDGEATPGGATVIRVQGDLDLESHLAWEAAIVRAIEGGAGPVTVDLSQVPFLDSSGVRALLTSRQKAMAHGTTLAVRDPQPIVAQVLRLTGVASLFGLSPS
jgi:anti-sigma B factor antagonist